MENVYVVSGIQNETFTVFGVFSSIVLAQAAIEEVEKLPLTREVYCLQMPFNGVLTEPAVWPLNEHENNK